MRLFIAIAPDDRTRRALARTARLLAESVQGRYVDTSLLHITLAFLGEVEGRAVPEILEVLRGPLAYAAPFQIRLGPLGTFGSILWRGVEENPALYALARKLRGALDQAGIAYDPGPFVPHFTLARRARGMIPEGLACLPHAYMTVRSVILYESFRAQGRLIYRRKAQIPLQG